MELKKVFAVFVIIFIVIKKKKKKKEIIFKLLYNKLVII